MVKPRTQRDASIASLKQRMERDPLSRAFLQLAEEYRRMGQFEDAVRVCQEGLARHPTYHTARIALGRTYLESGDLENARRTLSEVLELAPENHLAGKLLAEVQRKLGDRDGAVETYRAILRHYPGDREIDALLGDLLRVPGGDPEPGDPLPDYRPEDLGHAPAASALRDGASGVRSDLHPFERPGSSPVVAAAPSIAGPPPSRPITGPAPRGDEEVLDALQTNTLAELYLRQGLVDRAIEVYRSMLRVDPGHGRARRRLAELLSRGTMISPERFDPAASTRDAPGPMGAGPAPPETPTPPQTGSREDRPERRAITRLERWLANVRDASAGGHGTAGR